MLRIIDEESMNDKTLSNPLHEDSVLTVGGSISLLGHPSCAMPLARGMLGAMYALA
jgi:hypothetical protein